MLNGTFRILSDSIEAISAVKSDHRYKGMEEPIIKTVKTQSMDPSSERDLDVAHNLVKFATRSPHPRD